MGTFWVSAGLHLKVTVHLCSPSSHSLRGRSACIPQLLWDEGEALILGGRELRLDVVEAHRLDVRH